MDSGKILGWFILISIYAGISILGIHAIGFVLYFIILAAVCAIVGLISLATYLINRKEEGK